MVIDSDLGRELLADAPRTWLRRIAAAAGIPAGTDATDWSLREAIAARVYAEGEVSGSHEGATRPAPDPAPDPAPTGGLFRAPDPAPTGGLFRAPDPAPTGGLFRNAQPAPDVPESPDSPVIQDEPAPTDPAPTDPAPTAPPAGTPDAAAMEVLRSMFGVSEERIREIIAEEAASLRPRITRVVLPELPAPIDLPGTQHACFAELLGDVRRSVENGGGVLMVGPAGSGKTTAARQVAETLDVPFYFLSGAPTPQEHELRGYNDAHGNYVETDFYRFAKDGGVFLFDEIDAMYPGSLVWTNSVIANRIISFPNGERLTLPNNAFFVGAANTCGDGADSLYSARNKFDGATKDRFVFVDVTYDLELEDRLAAAIHPTGWEPLVARVRRIRRLIMEQGLDAVASPRTTQKVCAMVRDGLPEEHAFRKALFIGIADVDTRRKLEAA